MLGANAFGWSYPGDGFAGGIEAPAVILSLAISGPSVSWTADDCSVAWGAGAPASTWEASLV